jgi:hypothetical protein
MIKNAVEMFGTVVGAVAVMVGISFLLSWPVYMLWNGFLVDAITGVREITWLQAWGLNILANFLFKTTVSTKA